MTTFTASSTLAGSSAQTAAGFKTFEVYSLLACTSLLTSVAKTVLTPTAALSGSSRDEVSASKAWVALASLVGTSTLTSNGFNYFATWSWLPATSNMPTFNMS